MTKPLLFHYLESPDASGELGTSTFTKVAHEQTDIDPQPLLAATRTLTEARENTDSDALASRGTRTLTRVKNEQADADPGVETTGMWTYTVL